MEKGVKGVPLDTVDKLRKMLAYLDGMEDPEELRALAIWKAHILTGDRKGPGVSALRATGGCHFLSTAPTAKSAS